MVELEVGILFFLLEQAVCIREHLDLGIPHQTGADPPRLRAVREMNSGTATCAGITGISNGHGTFLIMVQMRLRVLWYRAKSLRAPLRPELTSRTTASRT